MMAGAALYGAMRTGFFGRPWPPSIQVEMAFLARVVSGFGRVLVGYGVGKKDRGRHVDFGPSPRRLAFILYHT